MHQTRRMKPETIPMDDVQPLIDALLFIRDECEWEYRKNDIEGGDHRIGLACDKAINDFTAKHRIK